jgi:predicted permease
MQISSLFFIIVIATVCLFGGIMAAGTYQANNPVNQSDSLGNMPSASTNTTSGLIGNVTTFEDKGSGIVILLIAIIVVICIVLGGAMMIRNGNLGRGKYRT